MRMTVRGFRNIAGICYSLEAMRNSRDLSVLSVRAATVDRSVGAGETNGKIRKERR
jgi:hypothetical protein